MDGVVLTKNVEIGESITCGVSSFNAGTVLFSVADVSKMIVKAGVNEVDIGKIHVGMPVKVTLDAYPKISFAGRIDRIAPAVRIDDKVRVFDVEIRLDAQGRELRSGMTANIEVNGERKDKVLTVPVESVFQRDERGAGLREEEARPEHGRRRKDVKKEGQAADKDALEEVLRQADHRHRPLRQLARRDREGSEGGRRSGARRSDAADRQEEGRQRRLASESRSAVGESEHAHGALADTRPTADSREQHERTTPNIEEPQHEQRTQSSHPARARSARPTTPARTRCRRCAASTSPSRRASSSPSSAPPAPASRR